MKEITQPQAQGVTTKVLKYWGVTINQPRRLVKLLLTSRELLVNVERLNII